MKVAWQGLGQGIRLVGLAIGLASLSLPAFAGWGFWGQSIWGEPSEPKAYPSVGKVTGVDTDYGAAYLGIPYALPPTGERRWQAPQALDSLPQNFQATQVGASCPQAFSPFGTPSIDEDCLFLNVYQPESAHWARWFGGLPVMVWIHGGAFTYGEGHATDPARLAEQGVIVVTLNYRLGALGFMSHPALTAENNTSGNYGLMDQQAALQWVQDNIAAFGGNPHKVTIFGESAGGLSVHAHLASDNSAGLFDKAIIQSGAYLLQQPSLFEWEFVGLNVAAQAGCPDQSAACLRSLPVDAILANQDPGPLGWLPIVDGQVLDRTMLSALQAGDFNQVPVMQGTTADEYTLFTALAFDLTGNFITPDTYLDAFSTLGFPAELAPILANQYPLTNYDSPGAAFSAAGTDFLFACNSQTSLQLLSQHVRTYGYEFNDPDAPVTNLPPVSFDYGAAHTTEIQYLMDVAGGGSSLFTPDQQWLSAHMVNYWSNFAKYGTPNGWFSPLWFRYGSEYQLMKSLEPATPRTISNFNERHQCDFWNLLLTGM